MQLARIESSSQMAMDVETVQENVRQSMKRSLPRLDKLPQWGKFKGEYPIAIVGGGPSLKDTLEDLRRFRHVMVCGSAHDFVIEQGIEPEYCVVLDPDPIAANYLKSPCQTTTYLIASQCDQKVFDALEHHQIAMFHCHGTIEPELVNFEGMIGGGCTVTLRAFVIALLMGYGNQHYFGFDSCYRGDEHHAYEAEDVDQPIPTMMMGSDRIYYCAPYHLAQAQQWQDLVLKQRGHLFTPTIHGDGLIAHIMEIGKRQAAAQQERL